MNPLVSWGIFITVVGVWYYFNQRAKQPSATWKADVNTQTKAVFVAASAGSGTDTGEPKKKKKAPAKKSALSNTVRKEVVSTDDAGSDDDRAEEVDPSDVVRRLQAIKQGGSGAGSKSSGRRHGANLGPSHSPLATASQTSSTGADGDIDEEETIPLGSSRNPSDMLEPPTTGPGVLKIGAPVQPPRVSRKTPSSAPEAGIHSNKNAKKKEKKKAEKEAARADQKQRFEQHRQAMRAEQAVQEKTKPAQAAPPASSAWSKQAGSSNVTPVGSTLLDTFVPKSESEDDKIHQSTTLGDSWESVPPHVQEPEPEWNEVKRKGRKDKRDETPTDFKSSDEAPPAPAAQPIKTQPAPKSAPKLAAKVSKSETGSTASASDAKTTSGSDWSQVDNIDAWAVHPESD